MAELAGYFRRRSRVPDAELVRLTAEARSAGSRWDAMSTACGITTYHDLSGVIHRITGETGTELLFSAAHNAAE
jgi:hypothetical protein